MTEFRKCDDPFCMLKHAKHAHAASYVNPPIPKQGELWKHYKGNLYEIVCVTNLPNEERYPLTIVYKTVANGNLWSRPYSDWYRSFEMAKVKS